MAASRSTRQMKLNTDAVLTMIEELSSSGSEHESDDSVIDADYKPDGTSDSASSDNEGGGVSSKKQHKPRKKTDSVGYPLGDQRNIELCPVEEDADEAREYQLLTQDPARRVEEEGEGVLEQIDPAAAGNEQQNVDGNNTVHVKEATKLKRQKRPVETGWIQNVMKGKRLKGESYTDKKGIERDEKKMGPPCVSAYCWKASNEKRNCQSVTEEQRLWIFDKFWEMGTWEERHLYVCTLCDKNPIKQKTVPNARASRRNTSFGYQLQLENGTKVPVCKSLFASTIGIPERTITCWLNKTPDVAPPQNDENPNQDVEMSPMGPKTGKRSKIQQTDLDFVRNWLKDLPTVESHYCRNIPSYQGKRFLYPGTTIAQLHRGYQVDAPTKDARVVSLTVFSKLFQEENYSVFVPRKDQCDVCVSYKHGNISQATYDAHIKAKDEARNEKSRDKALSSNEISVWTMDLQSVLLCPRTQASALYYRTKLQVHNFTLYNLQTKDAYCYVWDQTEGDLSSDVFAHMQYRHFERLIVGNKAIKKIIAWSDGCGYQNRNTTVANAYSELTRKYGVTIIQKYLVAGHTQMECDSMHSTIEQKLVVDVFTPRDYMILMGSARIKPTPYIVKEIKHDEFLKLDGAYFASIRPGKRPGDHTVHNLRALMYLDGGQVHFKLGFGEDSPWELLPQRVSVPNTPFKWNRVFQERLPLSARKFKDLQDMKHVIPAVYHQFFDTLPYA